MVKTETKDKESMLDFGIQVKYLWTARLFSRPHSSGWKTCYSKAAEQTGSENLSDKPVEKPGRETQVHRLSLEIMM